MNSRFGRYAGLASLGLVLVFLVGCQLQPALDLGPNPAVLELTLTASFTPKEVQDAKDAEQLFPPFFMEGVIQRLNGPYWDWGLYLIRPDGELTRLPCLQKLKFSRVRADVLQVKASFQAPPGKHAYQLLADAYLEYYKASAYVMPVDIKSYKEVFNFDLKPGQRVTIQRSYGK